jgi:ribose-phosphate pyrophosphokinase
MPRNEQLGTSIAAALSIDNGQIVLRRFPDDESYLRFETNVTGRAVALLCTFRSPDEQFLPLMFAAITAKELGAASVGLVAPYLAYMRQDCRFRSGEAVASSCFASLLSRQFDWIVTVDPHLHRHAALDEIFSIPTYAACSATKIAEWIRHKISEPVLIGPDSESKQWVSLVARDLNAPYVILEKERRGDFEVDVSIPHLERWPGRRPILVDDIVATGRTMVAAVQLLRQTGVPPFCIAVHAVFAGNAFENLKAAGAAGIVTTNTIPHPTNEIDVTMPLAAELHSALTRAEISRHAEGTMK